MCMVPHLLPEHMVVTMAALLMHLSIATGSRFAAATTTCVCVRSRTGLVKRHGKVRLPGGGIAVCTGRASTVHIRIYDV